MKKNLSKLFAMALALIMVMALTVPAMAAGTGSITVNDPAMNATYNAYKVFDVTYSGDAYAYKLDTTTTNGLAWYNALKDGGVFTFVESSTTGVYNVSSSADGATIGAALKTALTSGGMTAVDSGIKFDGEAVTEVKWENLDLGYYLVVSDVDDGAVVSLTTTNPDATVVEKNDGPGFDPNYGKVILVNGEKVDSASFNYGDTVTFEINIKATNYDGYEKITNYTIYDDMPDGLTGTAITSVEVDDTPISNYTSSMVAGTDTMGNYDFSISIPWTNSDGAFLYGPETDNDHTITVTYTATVANTAAIATAMENNAWFKYNDEYSTKDPATVYTYAVAIQKIDGDTQEELGGAEFKLQKQGDKYVVATGSNGVYTFTGWVNTETEATALVTDATTGQIIVKGLANGTYIFKETNAPDGYTLLDSTVTVDATATGSSSTMVVTYYKDGKYYDTQIEGSRPVEFELSVSSYAKIVANYTGSVLPSTGGMGTTLFYTIGGVLVVAAGVLLVTKKRMNNMEG